MKKPPRIKKYAGPDALIFSACLIVLLILNSCATGFQPKKEITPYRLPADIPSEIEGLNLRVKQNSGNVGKYFVLDEDGRIAVRADFPDRLDDYEVIYDLENVRFFGDFYEVDFFINAKTSGAHIEDFLVWRPLPGAEGILLALDDDFMEAWEQYFDLFDKYECRLTFFIQGEYDPVVTGPFCTAALDRGHEIGFHTINHPDLRNVSPETFYAEAIEPVKAYWSEGIPVLSFAYPFGFSEPWMHDVLQEYYDFLRGYGVTYRIYSEDEIRSGYIIAKAIDNTVIRGEENFRETVLSMLRTVKFLDDRRVLPITTHDISDEAAWGITAERLEFLLKSASDLNLKFYRYSDFVLR